MSKVSEYFCKYWTIYFTKGNNLNAKRYHILDSFRGLCAVAIVIHHLNILGSISELKFFVNADVFVDFFFVLSGFVLSVSNRNIEPRKFVISRVFRLFPLHIAMLTVFVSLELAKYIASTKGIHFSQAPFSGKNSLEQIIPNLFLVQSWFESFRHTSFNFPSWSISVELFLYISFIVYAFFTRPSILFSFCFCVVGALLLFSDIFPVHLAKGIFCFYFGVCVYEVHRKVPLLNISRVLATAIELLVLCLVVSITLFKDYFVDNSLVMLIAFVITFGLTILIYSFEKGAISLLLNHAFFRKIGELSYSIYLTHAAIILIITSVIIILDSQFKMELTYFVDGARFLNFGTTLLNNIAVIVIVLLTLLFSKITYKYVELKGVSIGKKINYKIISKGTNVFR